MQCSHGCSQNRLAETCAIRLDFKRVLGATPGHVPASHHLSQTPPPILRDGGGFIFSRPACMKHQHRPASAVLKIVFNVE